MATFPSDAFFRPWLSAGPACRDARASVCDVRHGTQNALASHGFLLCGNDRMSVDADPAPAPSTSDARDSPPGLQDPNVPGDASLPAGSSTWVVPRTAHTGGSWSVIDGFATVEECSLLIAAAETLPGLTEPRGEGHQGAQGSCDYRVADASKLTIGTARALALRAARLTGVPVDETLDTATLAQTGGQVTRVGADHETTGDTGGDDARSGMDSGGFLVNPTKSSNGDAAGKAGSERDLSDTPSFDVSASSTRELINITHDHDGKGPGTCTVFVFLSAGDAGGNAESKAGEKDSVFFPCVRPLASTSVGAKSFSDARETNPGVHFPDELAEGLNSLASKGTHSVWAGAEDEAEAKVARLCRERYAAVADAGSVPSLVGAPPGLFFGQDSRTPGMVVAAKLGRAVVVWHGEGETAEAWHAQCAASGARATYRLTFVKRGVSLTKPPPGSSQSDRVESVLEPPSAVHAQPAKALPVSFADSESEAYAALAALGAVAVASGKAPAPPNDRGSGRMTQDPRYAPDLNAASVAALAAAATAASLQRIHGPIPTHISHLAPHYPHQPAKHKGLCLVDGCENSRKQPMDNNRLPLTCPAHAGARAVGYQGQASRECQACRTFHSLSAFDRDNKTCETRLLRKKLRYRARTIGADADCDTATLAGNVSSFLEHAVNAMVAANKSLLVGGKIQVGNGPVVTDPNSVFNQGWESIHEIAKKERDTADALAGGGFSKQTIGAKRGLDAGVDGPQSTSAGDTAGNDPGTASTEVGGEKKKGGARRGRPPGSTNKNWTSKIVAASAQETQRKQQLQQLMVAEQAFVNLPPHLRAAYIQNLHGQNNPYGGLGHHAMAQAAHDQAATFAARHAALASGSNANNGNGNGNRHQNGDQHATNAAVVHGANAHGHAFHGDVSYHHAILQAQAEAQMRSHAFGGNGGFPFGGGGMGGMGGQFGGTNSGNVLSGLSLSSLAQLGITGAGDASAIQEANDRAAAQRANHLMQIANAMDPNVRADLLGRRAAAGGQDGGCCIM